MQDPTRLLLGLGDVLATLEPGERARRPERHVGVEHERHPGREDRVAPEQRHVPGRPGRDEHVLGVVGVLDLERPQVLARAPDGGGEARDVGVASGRLVHPRDALRRRERRVARHGRGDVLAAAQRAELHAPRPLLAGVQRHAPADRAVLARRGALAPDRREAAMSVGVGEPERGPLGAAGDRGHDHRAGLHLEQAGQVGVHAQRDLDVAVGAGEVADAEVHAHAPAHGEVAEDELSIDGPADERGRGRRTRRRRERLHDVVVDAELQRRADPRVADEQTLDPAGIDVTGRRGDRRTSRPRRG